MWRVNGAALIANATNRKPVVLFGVEPAHVRGAIGQSPFPRVVAIDLRRRPKVGCVAEIVAMSVIVASTSGICQLRPLRITRHTSCL